MSKQRTICTDCLGLLTHKLPMTRGVKAFIAGAIGFFSVFLEERAERCTECGLLRPWCFRYTWPDEDEVCVHCGVSEEHHANAGHAFRARTHDGTGVAEPKCAHVWEWEPTGHVNDAYLRCRNCRLYATEEQVQAERERVEKENQHA